MGGTVTIPGGREWLWTFSPWGLLLTATAIGLLTTGQYDTAMVALAAILANVAFMAHIRRLNRRNFLRMHRHHLSVWCRNGNHEVAFEDISFVDWLPGNGSAMLTGTARPPRIKITLTSGEVVLVELFFAKLWRERRAKSSLKKALPAGVLRG